MQNRFKQTCLISSPSALPSHHCTRDCSTIFPVTMSKGLCRTCSLELLGPAYGKSGEHPRLQALDYQAAHTHVQISLGVDTFGFAQCDAIAEHTQTLRDLGEPLPGLP